MDVQQVKNGRSCRRWTWVSWRDRQVDPAVLHTLLEKDYIPVVAPSPSTGRATR